VLDGAEDHARHADQHQRYADGIGEPVVQLGFGKAMALLRREQPQEQSEARDNEAERHDGETRAHPREQRALGGEENARIAQHGGHGVEAYHRLPR